VRRYTRWTLVREVLMILLAIVWMIPFVFLVMVAVKPDVEALQSPLSFPDELHLSNFSTAWNDAALGRSLANSLIITAGSVLALIAIGSICAYVIARRPGRMSTALYFLFVLAIILPFQLGLVPTYAVMRDFGLVGSYLGIILLYTGIWMPFAVFLYTGFVMALPKEYEEASRVDGATALRTFRKVVFPLLRPVTGTVAIFTGLIIWNDFFLSLIYLNGTDKTPLPVAVYTFVGAFASRWNLIFAAVLVSLLPILIFFLFAQRQLIRGFTGGIKT
jgi:raffinose/stachyose/melibiose transport system permease protein